MSNCKTQISASFLTCLRIKLFCLFILQSFSEDVFQSVKSLLQSEKELCSVSGGECLNQDEHAQLTEVCHATF